MSRRHGLFFALILTSFITKSAEAAGPTARPAEGGDERLNVEKIRKGYWEQSGNFEVVQNRLYSKSQRLELGAFGGFLSSDPFLSVNGLGASLGYHFTEFFSFHVLGWKAFSSRSKALEVLENDTRTTANTNPPYSYLGGEFSASTIYGKLSLLGKAILYYDLHFLLGFGNTSTESGGDLTQHIGIGQQIFVSQHMTVRVDYRLMHYREAIIEKRNVAGKGSIVAPSRDNWTSAITLGASFFVF